MVFEIESTAYYRDCEDILKNYPCLQTLPYQIKEEQVPKTCIIRDENGNRMTQVVGTKTIKHLYLHLDSLFQLMELIENLGHCVVVSNTNVYDQKTPTIEIYDSWRE